VIAESNPLSKKAKEELKSSETYYAKVIASAHNNVGLLWAERQDFRAAAEQFRLAASGIRILKVLILTWDWPATRLNDIKRPSRRLKMS